MTMPTDRRETKSEDVPRTERLHDLAARLPGALGRNERLVALADCLPIPLDVGGVAHDHLRLDGVAFEGLPAVARVSRLSQWRQPPADQLAYEAAAFAHAEASGVTPRLLGVLTVDELPPNGALIVEYVAGRKARFPEDTPALAECLAKLHAVPVPPAPQRVPLRTQDHPAAETLAIVEEQAAFMAEISIADDARRQIEAEISHVRLIADEARDWPSLLTFVGTDTHPGNYLIRDDGSAIFVDLEKAMFGMPAIDLAHATLYTSTMWDNDCAAALDREEVDRFYEHYLEHAGQDIRTRLSIWRLPMRRLTWLRTLTWCIRWRALSARDPDWAPGRMPAPVRAHAAAAIDDFLQPDTIARIRSEWK